MRKFLYQIIGVLAVLLVFNFALFFVSKKLYYNDYTNFSLDYSSYLLADSHGHALSNMTEEYGIYNFSYSSDSYLDMYRKFIFLLNNTKVDTIYILADEHSLSPYRETGNNSDRSSFYTSKEYDNSYEYFKAEFIKKYIILLQPKIRDVAHSYVSSKIKKILKFNSEALEDWANMDNNKRIKIAQVRVKEQFPLSDECSADLKQTLLQIINICKENNITLIGIKFPLSLEYLNALGDKTYGVKDVLESAGINILDYHNIFIHHNEYFQDSDHLNEKGAQALVKLWCGGW
jgi:hypothetical protein